MARWFLKTLPTPFATGVGHLGSCHAGAWQASITGQDKQATLCGVDDRVHERRTQFGFH